MSLADHIRTLGRGPGRSRHLTETEAEDALAEILSGEADSAAIGALLMLLRYRGENAAEIAGFIRALWHDLGDWATVGADVDWPSYAAGKSRGLPWFLLSAKLLAEQGQRVLIHGWNSHQSAIADVRAALPDLGIPVANTPEEARVALDRCGIAYAPLEALSAPALRLLQLRSVLGLRSPINTALRGLNPTGAPLSVQGVFHPGFRGLQTEAAEILGQQNLAVIKGAGGEFERHPGKALQLFGLHRGTAIAQTAPARVDATLRLSEVGAARGELAALWAGAHDPLAEAVVTGTAGLVLAMQSPALDVEDGWDRATRLWRNRHALAA